MTFTEDSPTGTLETTGVQWAHIEAFLNSMHPEERAFCHLTDPSSGSYIQCAGGPDRLAVELRNYVGGTFHHFAIGRDAKDQQATSWATIECKPGPINVLATEVLLTSEVALLFKSLMDGDVLPSGYVKRDVTSTFL